MKNETMINENVFVPMDLNEDNKWDSDAPQEPIEGLSDIDGLSVEWDGLYGRSWQTFTCEADMTIALDKNEAIWKAYREALKLYQTTHKPHEHLMKYICE